MIPYRHHSSLLLTVIIFTAATFVPFLYISIYTHPANDDFIYAYRSMNTNLWDGCLSEYMNWGGRYFTNFLVLINPIGYHSFTLYRIVPVIMIIQLILSFYFLTGSIPVINKNIRLKFAFTFLIVAVYLNNMPIISEGIYWYTGSVAYLGGIILSVYIMALLIRLTLEQIFINTFIHSFLIFLLIFLAAGTNEVIMIYIILLCSLAVYLKNNIYTKLFLIFSVLCGLIAFFAPGNSVRAEFFPDNHHFFYSCVMAAAQTLRFTVNWLSNGTLIISSLIIISILKQLNKTDLLIIKSMLPPAIYFLIAGTGLIFISAFLPYWATGILGQHRTLNVSCLFFIIFFILGLLSFFINNEKYFQLLPDLQYLKYIIGIFILLLIVSGNGLKVNSDLISGKAISFDKQMETRYNIIRNSDGPVYLTKIKNPPASIFVLDITPDSKNAQNICYALYFGKKDNPVILTDN